MALLGIQLVTSAEHNGGSGEHGNGNGKVFACNEGESSSVPPTTPTSTATPIDSGTPESDQSLE